MTSTARARPARWAAAPRGAAVWPPPPRRGGPAGPGPSTSPAAAAAGRAAGSRTAARGSPYGASTHQVSTASPSTVRTRRRAHGESRWPAARPMSANRPEPVGRDDRDRVQAVEAVDADLRAGQPARTARTRSLSSGDSGAGPGAGRAGQREPGAVGQVVHQPGPPRRPGRAAGRPGVGLGQRAQQLQHVAAVADRPRRRAPRPCRGRRGRGGWPGRRARGVGGPAARSRRESSSATARSAARQASSQRRSGRGVVGRGSGSLPMSCSRAASSSRSGRSTSRRKRSASTTAWIWCRSTRVPVHGVALRPGAHPGPLGQPAAPPARPGRTASQTPTCAGRRRAARAGPRGRSPATATGSGGQFSARLRTVTGERGRPCVGGGGRGAQRQDRVVGRVAPGRRAPPRRRARPARARAGAAAGDAAPRRSRRGRHGLPGPPYGRVDGVGDRAGGVADPGQQVVGVDPDQRRPRRPARPGAACRPDGRSRCAGRRGRRAAARTPRRPVACGQSASQVAARARRTVTSRRPPRLSLRSGSSRYAASPCRSAALGQDVEQLGHPAPGRGPPVLEQPRAGRGRPGRRRRRRAAGRAARPRPRGRQRRRPGTGRACGPSGPGAAGRPTRGTRAGPRARRPRPRASARPSCTQDQVEVADRGGRPGQAADRRQRDPRAPAPGRAQACAQSPAQPDSTRPRARDGPPRHRVPTCRSGPPARAARRQVRRVGQVRARPAPLSPVRTRTTWSTGTVQTLPSPIRPVWALLTMMSTTS